MEFALGVAALAVGLAVGFIAGAAYILHQITKDPWK